MKVEDHPAAEMAVNFHVVFMAATGLICGIGPTEQAAWAVARAIEDLEDPDEEDIIYDIKPCSIGLLKLLMAEGGDIPYDDRNGILVTEQEAKELATLKPVQ